MRIPPINDREFWSDVLAIVILGMGKVIGCLMGW